MIIENDPRLRALEENLFAQWSQFGRPDSCALHDEDGVLWFETPITSLPYNGVVRTHGSNDIGARIDAIATHFERRDAAFFWVVHPTASPGDLGDRLEARGLKLAETATGMVATPDEISASVDAPDGVVMRAITTADADMVLDYVATRWNAPAEAQAHLRVLFRTNRLGQPDAAMRGWIALRGEQLLGKAFAFTSGSTLGLYGVATKPEARGLGLASALCARGLQETITDDIRHVVLHASPMARGLYRRMGFAEVAPFQIFTHGADFRI